jgi:subtilisin family serine protease
MTAFVLKKESPVLSCMKRAIASAGLLTLVTTAFAQQPAPLDEALLEAQVAAFKAEHRAAVFDKLRDKARQEGGWARVIVEIDVPAFATLRADSVAAVPGDDAPDDELAAAIGAAADRELARLAILPHRVNRVFQTVPGMALTVSERALTALEASAGVIWISEDALAEPFLDESTVMIGAVEAWSMSLTGGGWWIAVLDTGLLASHRMFAGKPVVQACFSHKSNWNGDPNDPNGDCPNGLAVDLSANAARPFEPNYQGYDHGTHVAGIAVGKDTLTPRYGVARDAGLIAVQVFHRVPATLKLSAYFSDVIAGMEHVYSLRNSLQIAAVNLSLGAGGYFDDQQAQCDAFIPAMKTVIDNLRAANIATVAASGNFLPVPCYMTTWPACISSAVAVTAIDANGRFADFAMHNFMTDLSAPGVAINSATASGDDAYIAYDGTSMAAPHIAGSWALMRSARSSLNVTQVLNALRSTGNLTSWYNLCGEYYPFIYWPRLDRATPSVVGAVWVHHAYNGPEDGSFDRPWRTLAAGVQAVQSGNTIFIKAGNATELITITKPLTLRPFGGLVRIGQ